MEGVRVSRSGVVCWIGVATSAEVFLFDMCSLGSAAFKAGLAAVYQRSDIVKVVHDCRFMSDALLHKYSVKLVNVFDTQVMRTNYLCNHF